MPEVTSYPTGQPAWADVTTSDAAAAAGFYGELFGVWQAREHIGAQLAKEPGTLNWAEVQTHDRGAAQPFYERVFGYTTATIDMGGDEYVVFSVGDTAVAGLVQIRADWGQMPSNWSAVFQVGDCDAAVARVQEAGGTLYHGPAELAGTGRFAVVADPWGAAFQVIA